MERTYNVRVLIEYLSKNELTYYSLSHLLRDPCRLLSLAIDCLWCSPNQIQPSEIWAAAQWYLAC